MKTLYLMRHAKSAHGAGPSRDHERPLNQRGRDAAPAMGNFMATRGMVPAHTLCSDAARTRETLSLLTPELPSVGIIDFRSDLYLAGVRTLIKVVRQVPSDANSVLVIGHNPGLESLALTLANPRTSDTASVALIEQKFPTGGLAVLEFEEDSWSDIGPGRGRLVDFIVPRALITAAAG